MSIILFHPQKDLMRSVIEDSHLCAHGHTELNFFFFNLFILNLFIYLFMAALGLRCCARAFSSCRERGLCFIVVHGLLIAVASLVAEHRL